MSKYQTKIVEALKNGAKLQCTEGANYGNRLKRCKTNFKFKPKPSYCIVYVTGCF